VPTGALPTDVKIDAEHATPRGRVPIAGRLWDRVDLDDIEVASAYVVDAAELEVRPHAALRALWRAAFGGRRSRPEAFDSSFIHTLMKGQVLMAWGADSDDRDLHGPVYRTYIFGATHDQTFPARVVRTRDAAAPGDLTVEEKRRIHEHATRANTAFLAAQYQEIQRLIAREYAHLGFAGAPIAARPIGGPPPYREELWTTPDEQFLHLEHFLPRQGPPSGVVIFAHGFSAYATPYRHVAQALTEAQFAVTLYDARGHGHSTGRRGHVEHFGDYTEDLAQVVARARVGHMDVPVVLIGHSQGGAVVLDYLLTKASSPRVMPTCAVVAAPMLEITLPISPLERAAEAAFGRLFPKLQVANGIRGELVTRNEDVRAAFPRDPLVHHVVTPNWFRESRIAQSRLRASAAALPVPTLFLTAGNDRIVSAEAQDRFVGAAPAGMATQRSYPTLMHEVFLEPERDQVITDMVDWVVAQTGPGAAAAARPRDGSPRGGEPRDQALMSATRSSGA
jgi:alpha-beta hydrolase superfamily lysophospholipase